MLNIFISIFAFLVAIGILIAFHEFGHFYVARKFGIKVSRFSIGFGKPLWSFYDKQGTEYAIAAFPFGGYVKMVEEDEIPSLPEADRDKTFARKPVWIRIAVVFAGPFFNIIFAILAYWLMFMIGVTGAAPIIGDVVPDSIAMKAGLKANDEFVEVGGHPTLTWSAVNIAVIKKLGEHGILPVKIKRTNPEGYSTYNLNLMDWHIDIRTEQPLTSLGLVPYQPSIPAIIAGVIPGSPASKIKLKTGDRIIAIDGKPINEWKDLIKALATKANKQTSMVIIRDNQQKNFEVIPEAIGNQEQGYLGIQFPTSKMPKEFLRTQQYSIFAAMKAAFVKTWEVFILTLVLLWKMILGKISLKVMSGPIGIAHGAGVSLSLGLSYYLDFLALVSVSLAILNILPIPGLDGGHLLFFFIELIRGKPLSLNAQALGIRIGITLLLFLMFVAIINDLMRIFS